MFFGPKKTLKKFNPERCCFVLNEFSAAECASALEMLYASKNTKNKKLSIGFIRHALDEYKHSFIFNKNVVRGFNTSSWKTVFSNKIILTTRTLLNELIHIGEKKPPEGKYDKKQTKDFTERITCNTFKIGR